MQTAPLPARERMRLQTRDLILEAALEEIRAAGLSRARIDRIAEKAAVTRPTIYAHFPRKEDFLREFQARAESAVRLELTKRLGSASGAKLIHAATDAIFDLADSVDPVLRRECFALILREPPPQIDWRRHALFGFLTQRLAEAQARGELSDHIPAAKLTRLIVSALFGFLIVENEPSKARRRAAHEALDLLIQGVVR